MHPQNRLKQNQGSRICPHWLRSPHHSEELHQSKDEGMGNKATHTQSHKLNFLCNAVMCFSLIAHTFHLYSLSSHWLGFSVSLTEGSPSPLSFILDSSCSHCTSRSPFVQFSWPCFSLSPPSPQCQLFCSSGTAPQGGS